MSADARAMSQASENRSAATVVLYDVGPRDGLRNDPATLGPTVRAELCNRLAAAGLPRVEAASFVHPKRVPQMAGAEEVFAGLHATGDVVFSAPVLNRRGLERAIAAGAAEIGCFGGRPRRCPFAPRATGNIATEDLLYLLDGEGVVTGVDLDRLLVVIEWLAEALSGRALPGLVHRSGSFPPDDRNSARPAQTA